MEFRELTVCDRELITALFVDVFTREPWNDDWSDTRQLDAYITDHIGQSSSLTLGCFDGGRLAALSMGHIIHWHSGTEYCIQEFCVARDLQGKGIGTAFLKEIEAFLLKNGVCQIFLQTERDVPAFGFYLRSGFAELKNHVSLAKRLRG